MPDEIPFTEIRKAYNNQTNASNCNFIELDWQHYPVNPELLKKYVEVNPLFSLIRDKPTIKRVWDCDDLAVAMWGLFHLDDVICHMAIFLTILKWRARGLHCCLTAFDGEQLYWLNLTKNVFAMHPVKKRFEVLTVIG